MWFTEWITGSAILGFVISCAWLMVLRPEGMSAATLLRKGAQVVFSVSTVFAFLGLGGAFCHLAIELRSTGLALEQWPSTIGQITGHGVYEARAGKTRMPDGRWAATWTYRYVVNGHEYNRSSTDTPLAYKFQYRTSRELAEADGERRPAGSEVQVFYDPVAPERSVLDRLDYSSGKFTLFMVLGISLVVCALGGLWALRKPVREWISHAEA